MESNYIVKDERGKIRVNVKLWTDYYGWKDKDGNDKRYDVTVWHIPPRKSKEINNNSIATEGEIYHAKMLLWSKLKP